MTHILVLFSHWDFISVFMRQNTNTIESFESSHALTFSVISLEIVLHAYLFIGQGLRVYPKHFFFGVNTILLFAGLTCHLRPRLSCLLFRQNAKYRQDASFSFFSKSTLNLSARLSCWLFNSCKNAKSSRGGNKATKWRGRSSDIYAICSFEPLTYQLGGRNILLVKYFENFPISTFLFFLAMWSDLPDQQQEHPPCQRPPIAQSRVLILPSNWKWVNSGETQKVEFCWSKFSRCW